MDDGVGDGAGRRAEVWLDMSAEGDGIWGDVVVRMTGMSVYEAVYAVMAYVRMYIQVGSICK